MQGRTKQEIPEKTRRPVASSGTIPTRENPVTRPGIEPCSSWEASVLTAQTPRPLANGRLTVTGNAEGRGAWAGRLSSRDWRPPPAVKVPCSMPVTSTWANPDLRVAPKEAVTVAEWLACSPPTKANRVQSSAGSPALSFRCRSILPAITLIGSQDHAVSIPTYLASLPTGIDEGEALFASFVEDLGIDIAFDRHFETLGGRHLPVGNFDHVH
ncbi:hypothetical protein PR048_020515 [Dryococelus australis]|uniref:Uncharacterized protein n=1 Tax=Dryococelus australis TaxID=614101 RepID=A0ABQ9H6M7_9NEOP|nr:hypothetical protein PR048_020515 [Dryococelus australis]